MLALFTTSLILLLPFLKPITAAPATNPTYHGYSCLSQAEVDSITSRWNRIFVDRDPNVSDVLTSTFKNYNGNVNLRSGKPFVTGLYQIKKYSVELNNPATQESVADDLYTEYEVHTCNVIVNRWVEDLTSTGLSVKTTGIKAGKKIRYRGIDILKVDLKTRKIYEAITSDDVLDYYNQLGFSVQPKK